MKLIKLYLFQVTFQFIYTLVTLVPFIDCSAAVEEFTDLTEVCISKHIPCNVKVPVVIHAIFCIKYGMVALG